MIRSNIIMDEFIVMLDHTYRILIITGIAYPVSVEGFILIRVAVFSRSTFPRSVLGMDSTRMKFLGIL